MKNEEKSLDELSLIISVAASYIPNIEERKKEVRAKRQFVKEMPTDDVEEVAPFFLTTQLGDEDQLRLIVSGFSESIIGMKYHFDDSTGTVSAYSEMAYKISSYDSPPSPEIQGVIKTFSNLAEEKAKKSEIPERLEMIYERLGERFIIVRKNVDKARNGVMTIKQVLSDMRDFINSFWGNLRGFSEKNAPDKWVGVQSPKLTNEKTREAVAKSLAKDPNTEKKLLLHLSNLNALCIELSSTEIAKNILIDDLEKFNGCYGRWILLIDDIVGLLPFSK